MMNWLSNLLGAVMTLFARNWITGFGAILTTTSALLIIAFFFLGIFGETQSPYVGIIGFMFLPGIFVVGLLLIPIGAFLGRTRPESEASEGGLFPLIRVDLNSPKTRVAILIVAVLTLVNLALLSGASYQGLHHLESVEFCGTTCHTVMEPEYTAYLGSPHSRVKCVECHIGPGAPWFVRSKLSGVRQVFAVLLGTHSRPIPAPVHNLRPSRETCEECHWPEKFTGDRVKVINKFAEDEENSVSTSVLLMHIGGGKSGKGGIHSWHIDPSKKTRYVATDEARQEIAWVEVTESDGSVVEYVADDFEMPAAGFEEAEIRTMDCMDCHNRPSHTFKTKADALDQAMDVKRIDPALPYIKKVGMEILGKEMAKDAADAAIEEHVNAYYEENYAELHASKRDIIDAAIGEIQDIYRKNVFPEMNITWGTYPTNIGHTNSEGCFRCHDGSHNSEDGRMIEQDCMTTCHSLLAMEEENPEILSDLGIE